MILRRFMLHVKEQNWFAVGLDVIVVIVGIFLGLQVQSAYEERQAQEEEGRIVGYMIADMESSLDYLDQSISDFEYRILSSSKAIDILNAGVLNDEDIEDFEQAIIRLGRTNSVDPYLNSFDDENLSRIIDSDLRRVIGNYLSNVKRIKNIIEAVNERMTRAKDVRDFRSPTLWRSAEDIGLHYNFEQLKNDEQYLIATINMNSSQTSYKIRFEDMRDISQQMLQILHKYQAGETFEVVSFE